MTETPPIPAASSGSAASRVRYLIVGLCMVMAVLLYLHRFSFTFVQEYIREDLGLSDGQLSWLISAFFWSYALGQVPSGWLSDRLGARAMLGTYILVWSIFTGLMGLAGGFVVILGLRLGAGLGQAGAYPTAALVVSQWMPFSARGTASAFIAGGGRIGAIIAPVLTAYLVLAFIPTDQPARLEPNDLLDPVGFPGRLVGHVDWAKPDSPDEPLAHRVGRRVYTLMAPSARESLHELAQASAWTMNRSIGVNVSSVTDGTFLGDLVRQGPTAAWDLSRLRRRLARELEEEKQRLFVRPNLPDLVVGLNEVLERRDFYDEKVFAGVEPEREVHRLLARREELSGEQVVRLNRLLLEAVYKDDIKKLYGRGWRPVIVLYGAIGLLVAGLFWGLHRNRPGEHPWCNAAEAQWVAQGLGQAASNAGRGNDDSEAIRKGVRPPQPKTDERRPKPKGSDPFSDSDSPLRWMVRSWSLWMNSCAQFGTNIGWFFLVSWMPRYLEEVQHAPYELRSWMATLVYVVGWMGMIAGGRLTDVLAHRLGLRWGRALPIGVSRFTAAAAYLLMLTAPSQGLAVALFALVALSTDVGSPSAWAFGQDVGGRYVASVLGWGNMWGNFGAAVAPILTAWLFQRFGWDVTFVVLAAAFVFSGVCALGMDASKPIFPDREGAG